MGGQRDHPPRQETTPDLRPLRPRPDHDHGRREATAHTHGAGHGRDGGTDVLFALDSIPAIFGLTQNTYLVFTATAFSLLGLRQLYFLIDGLLDRLIYLSYGLAAILAFIGVKLILHALHEYNVPFMNSASPSTSSRSVPGCP
ncbi:TerC family protein [Actinomycetospora sp. CA-053990]|uniref:TerC family protein n=1 Tax=Actinomycetospora sp. CA-053990 TaxID=3239891 RepID=UPI003D9014D5